MGRWNNLEKLRFRYTYTDNGGVTTTTVQSAGRIATLHGHWITALITREEFKHLTVKVGRRTTVIEPAPRHGR
jgi:hypothetical protein